jgi:hypothetical protein
VFAVKTPPVERLRGFRANDVYEVPIVRVGGLPGSSTILKYMAGMLESIRTIPEISTPPGPVTLTEG